MTWGDAYLNLLRFILLFAILVFGAGAILWMSAWIMYAAKLYLPWPPS